MRFEHGKARPSTPRSKDLKAVDTVDDRPRQRDGDGRFTPGNTAALGRGALMAVRRLLGRGVEVTDPEVLAVVRDADRLFGAVVAELPSAGATVRQLVASFARHTALAGYWSAKASVSGLSGEEGMRATEEATKHDTRAERLAVTMLDVSTKLAGKKTSNSVLDLRARLAAKGSTS